MNATPMSTRPPSGREELLKKKFDEHLAAQSDLMDKLGQQLLTLELAIPGVYATVLKLISGDKAVVSGKLFIGIGFGCWFLALICTVISLVPRNWKVDRTLLKQDPNAYAEGLGVEDFFTRVARYKRGWLIAASLAFFIGVTFAAFSIF